MSILPINWHTRCLEDGDFIPILVFWISNPKSIFGKIWSKNFKVFLSAFPENLRTQYLEDVDSYSNISFLNSQPYFHFWVNLSQTIKSCPFCLKTCTKSISRMLILILTFVFWNSKPKSIFRENLSQKSQIVYFAWSISRMWFPGYRGRFGSKDKNE